MPHDFLLLALVAGPFLALTALRINAAFVFLSLCLGQVLVEFVSNDMNSFMRIFAARVSPIGNSTMQLSLLFVPPALTALFMIFSMRGRMRMLMNALPAAATSLFAALLAVPLLAPGLRKAIEVQSSWRQLDHARPLVVLLGAVLSLVFLWSTRKRQKANEDGHRRKR
ncbi:MAG TPA: hypothetical protein VIM53_05010 [Candidatus Saccharimonadales bacterium]